MNRPPPTEPEVKQVIYCNATNTLYASISLLIYLTYFILLELTLRVLQFNNEQMKDLSNLPCSNSIFRYTMDESRISCNLAALFNYLESKDDTRDLFIFPR